MYTNYEPQNVRSEQTEHTRIATNACKLLYVVAESLREKDQKNIDDGLKRGLEDVTGWATSFGHLAELILMMPVCSILEKLLELAEANAARGIFSRFWNSDANQLKTFREQLERRLPVFGVRFSA